MRPGTSRNFAIALAAIIALVVCGATALSGVSSRAATKRPQFFADVQMKLELTQQLSDIRAVGVVYLEGTTRHGEQFQGSGVFTVRTETDEKGGVLVDLGSVRYLADIQWGATTSGVTDEVVAVSADESDSTVPYVTHYEVNSYQFLRSLGMMSGFTRD